MFKRIITLSLLLLLTACASVTRSTREEFVINSDPEGAKAILSSGQTCITPCTLKLKRKHSFSVRFEKDGFIPAEATVDSHVAATGAAGFAGNVLLGGVIGAGVDVYSGATKGLSPNPLTVAMAPASGIVAPQPNMAQPERPTQDRPPIPPDVALTSLPVSDGTDRAAPNPENLPEADTGQRPASGDKLDKLAKSLSSEEIMMLLESPDRAGADAAAVTAEPMAPDPALSAVVDQGTVPPVPRKRETLDISRW